MVVEIPSLLMRLEATKHMTLYIATREPGLERGLDRRRRHLFAPKDHRKPLIALLGVHPPVRVEVDARVFEGHDAVPVLVQLHPRLQRRFAALFRSHGRLSFCAVFSVATPCCAQGAPVAARRRRSAYLARGSGVLYM